MNRDVRRALRCAAAMTGTVLMLTSCGSDGGTAGTESTDSAAEPTADPYCTVAEGLDVADFEDDLVTGADRHLTGDFEFALVDITGDGEDELLVRAVGNHISATQVFAAGEDGDELTRIDRNFYAGAASTGGFRAELHAASDGSGLLSSEGQSGAGQYTTEKWTVDGSEMVETGDGWDFRLDQKPDDLESLQAEIEWGSVGDVCVDGAPNPTRGSSASGPAPDRGSSPEPSDGEFALTGTVVEMTAGELMEGGRTPNGEPTSDIYVVLQLDSPTPVSAQQSGSPGQTRDETVSEISLATPYGSLSSINWDNYIGEQVTVDVTADGLMFLSDTGLPLGMVRLTEGTVE